MSLARCVFALRLADTHARPEVERRVAALAALHEPIGTPTRVLRWTAGDAIAAGAISLGAQPGSEGALAWGTTPPAGLDLLAAGDAELRRLDGPLGAVAVGEGRAVAVAAAGGPTALFAATGRLGQAWSSHATAAAWLAGHEPAVNRTAVAEQLGAEHLGGDRTLVEGVRAVQPATRVEIGPDDATESCFWPRAERWAPVPEPEAAHLAGRELLASLDRRLASRGRDAGAPGPVLGLTGGLDSAVVLAALRELGLSARTFTYGDPASADARGAAAAAAALGFPHEAAPFDWWPDEPGLARLRAEACWFDGARPAGFAEVAWPAMSHWVAGIGGETGRAFLYRWSRAAARAEPSADVLARVLDVQLGERLVGADRAVRSLARQRWREAVTDASELGARGWRTLDIVYAEQRVRRWGRAMLPRPDAAAVPAFATPELQRALAWLPLEDRLTDAFARRFIASHAPEIAVARALPGRRGLVSPLVRRRALQAARAARRSLRLPRPRRPAERWFEHPPWDERPRFVEWLTGAVLESPLLDDAVGGSWLRSLRESFLRGDPAAAEVAMWGASVVALDEGMRELRRLGSGR